jgi:hypothetical protein
MGRSTPSSDVIARAYDEATWQLSFMRIRKTNAILSPALPERNPENTPGVFTRRRQRPLLARDADCGPSTQRLLPQQRLAARRSEVMRGLDMPRRMG